MFPEIKRLISRLRKGRKKPVLRRGTSDMGKGRSQSSSRKDGGILEGKTTSVTRKEALKRTVASPSKSGGVPEPIA